MKRRYLLSAVSLLCLAGSLTAQAPDRSKPPELGPPPVLQLPPVTRHELSNGLTVLLLEKHQVPIVQVNVVVKAGSAMDPDDRPGLASVTGASLDDGAGRRDALELADAVAYLGAQLNVSVEQHVTTAALNTPVAQLDSALVVLADVVLRPTFPAAELDRLRRDRLTELAQQHDEPRAVAQVLFMRTVFGTAHPYGRRAFGTEAALRALTPDELRRFHAAQFRPGRAALIVVGDVTAAAILPKLEAAFGGWAAGPAGSAASGAPRWKDAPQVARREVLLVNKPGAAQTEVIIGRVGAPRSTADYFALLVMNTALGGSFTSRLNQNLREDKGYTYGAGSGFQFERLAGPFSARAAVQTAVTDKALTELFRELTRIRDGITAEELARAKNFVALRFPERFQAVGTIARQLGELVEYDLPLDYYNSYVQRVLAVTAADVRRVARQYVDPSRVVVVLVGDRETIEAGVRALNLGPLRTLTIEDVLGPVPVVTTTSR
ncbi:MAG: M16 family metallopeptidase [Gemmatimonadales bacterium]